MSDVQRSSPTWARPADRPILEFLRERRAEYPAIVANRVGMHAPHVEQRCEVLAEHGLLEAVSGEVVYRLTEDGEAYLDGTLDLTAE